MAKKMAKLYDIMLMDVPQEGGFRDEKHVTVELTDEITRNGEPYYRTKERVKSDSKSFTVYRRNNA